MSETSKQPTRHETRYTEDGEPVELYTQRGSTVSVEEALAEQPLDKGVVLLSMGAETLIINRKFVALIRQISEDGMLIRGADDRVLSVDSLESGGWPDAIVGTSYGEGLPNVDAVLIAKAVAYNPDLALRDESSTRFGALVESARDIMYELGQDISVGGKDIT